MDAPLLGLHPGIITSGIASLFRGKPDPPIKPIDGSSRTESGTSQRSHSTDIDSITTGAVVPIDRPGEPDTQSRDTRRYTVDPYFNQPFPNDVNFRDRGWWKNVVHFVKKHNSEGLMDAATNHLMSHMKFGACLMDFAGLKRRYETLRKLEDIDDIKHHGMPHVPARIRFVQYYTVCYGYPKKPKDQATTEQETTASEDLLEAEGSSQPSTRRISAEEHDGTESQIRTHQLQEIPKDEILDGQRSTSVVADNVSISSRHLGSEVFHTPSTSRPVSAKSRNSRNSHEAESSARLSTAPTDQENLAEPDSNPNGKESELVPDVTLSKLPLSVDQEVDEFERSLPPLPDVPKAPQYQAAQDPSNKEAAKYAEKENKRKLKDYERAIKSYEAAQKSRQKTLKKIRSKIEAERKKTLSKAEAKAEAEQKKERATEEAERKKEKATEEAERKKEKATEEAERKKADAKAKHDNQEAAEEKAKANAVAQDYHDLSRALASHATDVGGDNQKRSSMEILEPLPIEEELPLSEHTHQEELDNLLSPASTTDGKKIERTTEGVLPKPPARSSTKSTERSEKPRKLRKFCTTPSKVNGQMDEKWISVFMEDVDEVAAHTGLFFPGPQYEKLLGDVGIMIKSWVEEDATKRLLVENRFVP